MKWILIIYMIGSSNQILTQPTARQTIYNTEQQCTTDAAKFDAEIWHTDCIAR